MAEVEQAKRDYELAVATAQRELKAIEDIRALRRAERDSFRAELQTLRQRAYDLTQALPRLARDRADAHAELQRRRQEASVLLRIGEDLVQQREQALAYAHAELQRLRGSGHG